MDIVLEVNKANVYEEVAKTTSYRGSKLDDDGRAYERLYATDADRQMLERFWNEACSKATDLFRRFIRDVSQHPESHGVELTRNYRVVLSMPSNYDASLTSSMQTSLHSFFVEFVIGRWYSLSNTAESESYIATSDSMLDDVRRKLYTRRKPIRPGE